MTKRHEKAGCFSWRFCSFSCFQGQRKTPRGLNSGPPRSIPAMQTMSRLPVLVQLRVVHGTASRLRAVVIVGLFRLQRAQGAAELGMGALDLLVDIGDGLLQTAERICPGN